MALIPYLSLIVCSVGLLLWGILRDAKDPWPSEVGKVMFAAGLLSYLLKGTG